MKHELELKLQAYLDGELEARQARDLEAQVRGVPEAEALLAELKLTAAFLRGNELEHALPETREFYWSKIERAIEAQEKAARPGARPFWLAWIFRYWPQLSGAGVAGLLLAGALLHSSGIGPAGYEDIENPLSDTGTFTYRSEQQRMTLVWISSGSQEQEEETDSVD